ncbi:T9SS type B sorting domain-containing protein [Flavobacterium sp. 245]|uniref:T9SS type B sorting domain-containing protein n=1 Tax=Flavobacterium sp. 245 TaxID=2512115 RepID=UPI001061248F|nr:T9SS type B sorting domain-containing protein [Flavobacterium sp. 245]TDO94905.1 gliding motility-associated-like protein [Flavobacterium sp. 245]
MKRNTILKSATLILVMLLNFATYSQNLVSFNSKVNKYINNVFLNTNDQYNNKIGIIGNEVSAVKNDAVEKTNPVIKYAQSPYAGIVSQCPIDGVLLPKLFLCGLNDSRLIQTGITDASFITWQRRTGGCRDESNGTCANKDGNCTWADVADGPDYLANSSGEFRVKIRYQTNAESVFYFNVYKNELDPSGIIKRDIIKSVKGCETLGQIIAGGFGDGYEYSFTTNSAPDLWQDSNVFQVSSAGSYNIFIRLKGVAGGCVFNVKNTVINAIDFSTLVTAIQPKCVGEKGIINIKTNALNNQLKYLIYKDGSEKPVSDVGPLSLSDYEFIGLNAGSYKIVTTIDGTCAIDEQIIEITSATKITNNSAITQALTSCNNGIIKASASGGSKPYRYSVNIDDAGFQDASNGTIIVLKGGNYVIRVEDLNGCIVDKTILVNKVVKPEYTITSSSGKCGEKGTINVNLTNANGFTIEYSKDNGVIYQNGNGAGIVFSNLSTGQYNIIVRYKKNGVNNDNNCSDAPQTVTIGTATALTASAGIRSQSGCGPDSDPSLGIARITNPQGGTPFAGPNLYLYSFDNQLTWVTQNEGYIKPGGPYSVYIKDAIGCIFEMGGIKLDAKPPAPTITISDPVYNCTGTATATVIINGGLGDPKYSYEYYLDGLPNPNKTNPNIFLNVPKGDHYISVDYTLADVGSYSSLLDESFGSGESTTSPGINNFYYCFERQLANQPATNCNGNYAINDGDYTVTSYIDQTAHAAFNWRFPKDHTSNGADAKGRFLVVNIGDQIPATTILYEKKINDVIPNQPINFDFYVMNLMKPGTGKEDPDLRIALVDANGSEISWFATGAIVRSSGDTDWKHFPQTPITLNPGNNTSLRLIIRSNKRASDGNDFALDDIKVFQIPKACGTQSLFKFKVNSNKAFSARVENVTAAKCKGDSNGSFTIYAENYLNTFEYSVEGQPWKSSSVSPVTVSGLEASNTPYSVKVRYNASAGDCDFDIPTIVTSSETFLVDASASAATCSDGATIKATATGGTEPYSFILTNSEGVQTPFLSDGSGGGILTQIQPGTYTVLGTDNNSCTNSSKETTVVIDPPVPPKANIVQSTDLCFNNNTGASINVSITDGVGPFSYQVSRDGGSTYGPLSSSFNERTFTYKVLAAGTYDFIIIDKNSCKSTLVGQTIAPMFDAAIEIKKTLSCLTGSTDAKITVTISGGTSPYTYIIKNSEGIVLPGGATINTNTFDYTTGTAGVYTFEITDAIGCSKETSPVTINDPEPVTASYTKVDPTCTGFNDGIITLKALTGVGPFQFSIDNGVTFNNVFKFGNLVAGSYKYVVRDFKGCDEAGTILLNDPPEISMNIVTNGITCNNPTKPGSFDVNVVSGGTAPYVYHLYNNSMVEVDKYSAATVADAAATHNFSGLVFGDYYINVTDAKGCEYKSSKLRIEPLPYLNVTGTVVGATCADGISITLGVTGGTGPNFMYTIYGIGTTSGSVPLKSYTFNHLDQNTNYVFEVTDSNGCPSYIEIKTPKISNLAIDPIISTDVTCNGAANGEVTFTISNYNAAELHFEVRDNLTNLPLNPPIKGVATGLGGGGYTDTLKGLKPGNYSLFVKEFDGTLWLCSTSEVFQINQPTMPLDSKIASVVNGNCQRGALVAIETTGGKGPYSYAAAVAPAIPSVFLPSNVLELPAPGENWNIIVKDSQGCTFALNQMTIIDPSPVIDLSIINQCADENAFALHVVEITPGTGAYDIKIDNRVFTSIAGLPYDVMGLTSGSHEITIRDANGCSNTKSITINAPLKVTPLITKLPVCNSNTGEVILDPSGGAADSSLDDYEFTKDNWSTTQASEIFGSLIPGKYNFMVRDKRTKCETGCEVIIPKATDVIGLLATTRNVTCFDGSDGGISVNIDETNDNPQYTYSLSGSSISPIVDQVSSEFSNLKAGTYTITVKSGRGCTSTLENVVVGQSPLILVTKTTVAQYTCASDINRASNATITIDKVEGGSGKYVTYQFLRDGVEVQNKDSNVYTETDHLGGSYIVNVYDHNNCVGTSWPLTINPFVMLDDISFSKVLPISCSSGESIKVNVAVTGTIAPPLKFTLTGIDKTVIVPETNNTGEFSGLGIGDYLITVINTDSDCEISDYYHVFDPNTFEIKVNPIKSDICYGASNGTVELTLIDTKPLPTDEAGAFNYSITGAMPTIEGQADNSGPLVISGLIAGEYNVVAKLVNTPGCEVVTSFHISQPQSELTLNETHTEITCKAGNMDGTITANAEGGWPGGFYQYELRGPVSHDYSEEFFFENLTAGHYIVNVKDSKGCIDSVEVDLVIPNPIQFTATPTATVLSCHGDDSGVITVSLPTGGQGSNYNYILNYTTAEGEVIKVGPQDSNVFSGLVAGSYTVIVTDGFGCETTSANIMISDPVKVRANLSQESGITCYTDATLTLTATGGKGPYTYSEDGITYGSSFDSKVTFTVKAGAHHYYIKDALGCVSDLSGDVKVEPIVPLSIELDLRNAKVNCTGDYNAIIFAKATGGLGNYLYSLLDKNNVEIRSAQADGIFANLNATSGPYTVHVKSRDCEENSIAIPITAPEDPLIANPVITPIKCFGEKNGAINVTATGGTGVIKYAISPNLDMFVESGTFERLEAGLYTVIVQDILGCSTVYKDIEVKGPQILIASEIPNSLIPEICKGDKDGAFFIQVKGGLAPYFESLDNLEGPFLPLKGPTKDYLNQSGGKHRVYIKDSNGCMSEVEINMPEPVMLNPTYEIIYDCVNNAQSKMVIVTVDKSNKDLTQVDYSLDTDVGPWQSNNIFTNVAPGSHYIVARHTNGCKVPTASFDIKPYDPLTLALSEGQQEMNVISVTTSGGAPGYEFSFNGEPFTSTNKYEIYKSGDYVVVVRDQNGCTATINVPAIYIDVCLANYFTPNGDGVYDTWGPGCTNIYHNLEFSIFDRYGRLLGKYHYGQKWDGRYNSTELPSGDYWYVLKLNDEKDNREFIGHFTLYR